MLELLGILVFAAGLLFSIAWHEIGHLLPAKKFGVKVTQYMVGFGPTLWSRNKGETEYGIKAIPMGGYIRMVGMFPPKADGTKDDSLGRFGTMIESARVDALAEIEPGEEARAFYNLSAPKKLTIMFGGPFMNLILAFVLFIAVFSGFGLPKPVPTVSSITACVPTDSNPSGIASVDGSCADGEVTSATTLGLQAGDVITAINGTPIKNWGDIGTALQPLAGSNADVTYVRDGISVTKNVKIATLNYTDDSGKPVSRGFIGMSPSTQWEKQSPTVVPGVMGTMMKETFTRLFDLPKKVVQTGVDLVTGNERDANGPVSVVGIGRISGQVAASGVMDTRTKLATMVELLASVNLLLFVFNMVPLLPLDGGHIAGAIYEGIRRQVARFTGRKKLPGPADTAKMLPVAYVVSLFLVVMSVVIILADIFNPLNLG